MLQLCKNLLKLKLKLWDVNKYHIMTNVRILCKSTTTLIMLPIRNLIKPFLHSKSPSNQSGKFVKTRLHDCYECVSSIPIAVCRMSGLLDIDRFGSALAILWSPSTFRSTVHYWYFPNYWRLSMTSIISGK